MTGLFVLFGGMVLFATIIVGLDYLGRRQQRKESSESRLPPA
jgi:hypothetical protein